MRIPLLLLPCLLMTAPAPAQRSGPAIWIAGGAAVAGALLLDRTIESSVPDGGGERLEWATRGLNYGGRPQVALPVIGAAWAAGELGGRRPLARGAVRIGAGLLAAGAANGALKVAVGRERPSRTDDPFRLQPLNLDNAWQAFPSGHATVAFSLATGISGEARRPWVTAVSHAGAGLVAWSRVYDDKHWASDVVAGAVLGVGVTRAALRAVRRAQGSGAAVRVTPLPGGAAIHVPVR